MTGFLPPDIRKREGIPDEDCGHTIDAMHDFGEGGMVRVQ